MEKIIIACCWEYLEESGISRVLVTNEMFGPQVVKSVLEGSPYVRGQREIEIIAESMEHLRLSTFFNAMDTNNYGDCFVQPTQLQSSFHAADRNLDFISEALASCEDEIAKLLADLDNFRITDS